jgi:hypothetical protein
MRFHPVVVLICASSDDDEVRGLEARSLEVELLEAGRDAGDVLFALVQALDVLERVAQDLADGERAAFQAPLGEAEDPALGVVHQRLHVVLRVERLRDDLARGLDELAQHGAVADDRRVGAEVGGDGALLDEQGERGGPAHELQLIAAPELFGQRQHVHRLAPIEQGEHRAVDHAMRVGVEVRGLEHLDHARKRFAAFQKDGAEHGALGVQVVRRNSRRNFERAHATASMLR